MISKLLHQIKGRVSQTTKQQYTACMPQCLPQSFASRTVLQTRRVKGKGGGGKIRSAYLTPAFSGAQKRAELLRTPRILGAPRYLHLSIVSIIFSRVCPQDSRLQGVPMDINVYGGDSDMEIEGGTTCSFGAHIVD